MRKIKIMLVAIAMIFGIALVGLTSMKKEVNNESIKDVCNVVLLSKEVIDDENPEYFLRLSKVTLKHAKEANL